MPDYQFHWNDLAIDPMLDALYEGLDVRQARRRARNIRVKAAMRHTGIRVQDGELVIGGLGAEFLPDESGELLVMVAVADPDAPEESSVGLSGPLVDAVLNGALGTPEIEALGAGVLMFDRADVRQETTPELYGWLAEAVVRLLTVDGDVEDAIVARVLRVDHPDVSFEDLPPAELPEVQDVAELGQHDVEVAVNWIRQEETQAQEDVVALVEELLADSGLDDLPTEAEAEPEPVDVVGMPADGEPDPDPEIDPPTSDTAHNQEDMHEVADSVEVVRKPLDETLSRLSREDIAAAVEWVQKEEYDAAQDVSALLSELFADLPDDVAALLAEAQKNEDHPVHSLDIAQLSRQDVAAALEWVLREEESAEQEVASLLDELQESLPEELTPPAEQILSDPDSYDMDPESILREDFKAAVAWMEQEEHIAEVDVQDLVAELEEMLPPASEEAEAADIPGVVQDSAEDAPDVAAIQADDVMLAPAGDLTMQFNIETVDEVLKRLGLGQWADEYEDDAGEAMAAARAELAAHPESEPADRPDSTEEDQGAERDYSVDDVQKTYVRRQQQESWHSIELDDEQPSISSKRLVASLEPSAEESYIAPDKAGDRTVVFDEVDDLINMVAGFRPENEMTDLPSPEEVMEAPSTRAEEQQDGDLHDQLWGAVGAPADTKAVDGDQTGETRKQEIHEQLWEVAGAELEAEPLSKEELLKLRDKLGIGTANEEPVQPAAEEQRPSEARPSDLTPATMALFEPQVVIGDRDNPPMTPRMIVDLKRIEEAVKQEETASFSSRGESYPETGEQQDEFGYPPPSRAKHTPFGDLVFYHCAACGEYGAMKVAIRTYRCYRCEATIEYQERPIEE